MERLKMDNRIIDGARSGKRRFQEHLWRILHWQAWRNGAAISSSCQGKWRVDEWFEETKEENWYSSRKDGLDPSQGRGWYRKWEVKRGKMISLKKKKKVLKKKQIDWQPGEDGWPSFALNTISFFFFLTCSGNLAAMWKGELCITWEVQHNL